MMQRGNGVVGQRSVTTGELIVRLEAELLKAGDGAVIATDCDGTLWAGDVGEEMFELAFGERLLRDAARSALAVEARSCGLADDGDANELGAALLIAQRAGRYDEGRAFAMMAWAFAGFTVTELAEFARRVLERFELARRQRVEMRAVLDWAEARGVPVHLVSASPHAIIEVAASVLDIAAPSIIAMRPSEEPEGVIAARLLGAPTYEEGKVLRLVEVIGERPLLAAFGDSGWDFAMLKAARVAVAVYPAPGLEARLSDGDGVLILGGGYCGDSFESTGE
ncbi:MAG: haloacid dehalogenase-like hydrolase [Myxococcales bacterium]|nr:haloacid dehalogenase-like hydrolase [Myxococcales bacterium]